VSAPDDVVVLRPPPPPPDPIADVGAAVRDALRFPLSGPPLAALVPRGGRATILTETPVLPLPGAAEDPRQAAVAAARDELRRAGVEDERITVLVAGGLERRPGRRELENLVSPHFALEFGGRVLVHDAADPELLPMGALRDVPLLANRALVETDLVLVVTAAETVLHGGPAALLAAGGAEALRAASAPSLLETGGSLGWELALALERTLSVRVPLLGASLALDHPRLPDALWGYPYAEASLDRIVRSPIARTFRLLPAPVRMRALRSIHLELTASAVFAGPPSIAHAEALLRAIESRSAELESPLDALCIGIPRLSPHLPHEAPNPLLAAYLGLGFALRLWRDAFPVVDDGTAVLVHRFRRRFNRPAQEPYRAFFQATARTGPDPEVLVAAEHAAAADEQAIEAYRAGRSCHPLLPFADWAGCAPALQRLGSILVADCRDAAAARQLGFVPAHGVAAALTMAAGRAGANPRIGFLLSPPYFPLRVGGA
jgi:Lactate racemase N-terminal domain